MGRGLAFGLIAAILGCGGGGNSGGSGGAGGGSSNAASGAGGGSSASGNATSTGAGMTGNACPRVDLGGAVPIMYKGDTTGAQDLVMSSRLEWGSAPDDSLLFTAPADGTYAITVTSEPSTNGGCGASMQEFADIGTNKYYDETSCPAMGTVNNIDGVYAGTGGMPTAFPATKGQKVLIWVSCTTWSNAQMGAYTLSIQKM